jgi:hypothetical protein
MTDILRLTLIIFLLTISLSAFFLVIGSLFPGRITRTKSIIELTPGRSFGLGMVNFLFFGLIAIVLLSVAENAGPFVKGILTIPALVLIAFLAVLLSFGLTSMAHILSERLFPDAPAWKRNLWGSALLCFACALPFVGWLLLLPYVGFVGIGATILGIVQKRP